MKSILIVHHPFKPSAAPLAAEVEGWLVEQGHTAWTTVAGEDRAEIDSHLSAASLMVVLGGDGSILRAARLAATRGVPIFGINLGRVGFLSEAEPENWKERLACVLAGKCWLERRLMLRAALERAGQTVATFAALNDVVVGRGTQARVLHLHLFVDGDHVTTYTADGLIVATPTGSTAYAMAAGGQLLPPMLSNFLVMPVAPHLSLDRALVLHEDAEVTVQVTMDHEATVTTDGQDAFALQSGDRVLIGRHELQSCFARVDNPSYFYHRLMERFGYWHPARPAEQS